MSQRKRSKNEKYFIYVLIQKNYLVELMMSMIQRNQQDLQIGSIKIEYLPPGCI